MKARKKAVEINVTRVLLRGPENHELNFRQRIVPRLYDLAKAVYKARSCEFLRKRLMTGMAEGDIENIRGFFEDVGVIWVDEVGLEERVDGEGEEDEGRGKGSRGRRRTEEEVRRQGICDKRAP